jgi:hypothetical protein
MLPLSRYFVVSSRYQRRLFAGSPTPGSSKMSYLLVGAGLLGAGAVVGSFAGLFKRTLVDIADASPKHRTAQLEGAIEAGKLIVLDLEGGQRVFVRDVCPPRIANGGDVPIALLVGGGLGLSDRIDSFLAQGLRVVTFEEVSASYFNSKAWGGSDNTISNISSIKCRTSQDLGIEAAKRDAGIEAQASLISAVLNATEVTPKTRIVVVAEALEWLPAIAFCRRNVEHVHGLLLVDPLMPNASLRASLPKQPAAAAQTAPDNSADSEATRAVESVVGDPTQILSTTTFDPLHVLEHAVTGSTHHHLFCAGDHTPPPSSSAAAGAQTAADTLDPTALHTEFTYRSHLYGLEHSPSLSEMLPDFGQSVAPSMARGGLGTLVQPDARVAALDLRLEATAQACADCTARDAWVASLWALAELIPVRVRIAMGTPASLGAARWDEHSGEAVKPSVLELELRHRLEVDAQRRLEAWRHILPRRVMPIPAASPESRHAVFEADAGALASAAMAMARAPLLKGYEGDVSDSESSSQGVKDVA